MTGRDRRHLQRHVLRRRWGAAMAALGLVGVLAGCTSARNTLGTSSSPCYKAIPVAADAVHDRGTLVGIRLFSARQVSGYHHLDALLDARAQGVKAACVAAYHGTYRHDQVKEPYGIPPASGTGPIALVMVSYPQNKLIGTIVLSRVPLPLRHEVLRRPPVRARPPGSAPYLAASAGPGPA